MAMVTMLSVTGSSKYDGEGSTPLISFKHIDRSSGVKKKHHVKCKDSSDICAIKAEMRLVKNERMFECRFIDPGNEFNNFAQNLEGIQQRQEITGFERYRLFAVYLYLTGNLKSEIPSKTDLGVKLKDVQIMRVERMGNEIHVAFSGMEAVTNINA